MTNKALALEGPPRLRRLIAEGRRPRAEGERHRGASPARGRRRRWRFIVDTKGPEITFDSPGPRIPSGDPLRVPGTLEAGASLIADGRPVLVKDGRFTISWKTRPTGAVTLVATDPLRNATTKRICISIQPRPPSHPVRAVHVTSDAWADPALRQGVLNLIDQGRINAVELDLKDESRHDRLERRRPARARDRRGPARSYDLAEAVRQLHAKGVRVIGRLVCFSDPILAQCGLEGGQPQNQVIQTPGRRLLRLELRRLHELRQPGGAPVPDRDRGRRRQGSASTTSSTTTSAGPTGRSRSMVFPGLKGTPEQSIVVVPRRDAQRAEAVQVVPRRVGLRRRRDAPDGGCPEHPGDGAAPRLRLGDGLPVALGAGRVRRRATRTRSRTTSSAARSRTSRRTSAGRARASCRGCRTSRSASTTARPRSAQRSQAARDAGIDEYLLWDPAVTYTAGALSADARAGDVREAAEHVSVVKNAEAGRARARAGADAPPDPRRTAARTT